MAKQKFKLTGNLMGGEGMRFSKDEVVEVEEKDVEKFVKSGLMVLVEKTTPTTAELKASGEKKAAAGEKLEDPKGDEKDGKKKDGKK